MSIVNTQKCVDFLNHLVYDREEEVKPVIVFGPVFQMLSENGWNSYRLRREKKLSEGTIQRLRNGAPVNTTTIDILCELCNCQPGDILHYVPGTNREGQE